VRGYEVKFTNITWTWHASIQAKFYALLSVKEKKVRLI